MCDAFTASKRNYIFRPFNGFKGGGGEKSLNSMWKLNEKEIEKAKYR